MIPISYIIRKKAYLIKYAGLVDHAKTELKVAGLFDKDSDYGGMIGKAVIDLCDVFSKQGHSGFSANCTLDVFNKLAKFENLTPLTNKPSEWCDVSKESGYPFWQNKRNSKYFSKDGGKTWYSIEDK